MNISIRMQETHGDRRRRLLSCIRLLSAPASLCMVVPFFSSRKFRFRTCSTHFKANMTQGLPCRPRSKSQSFSELPHAWEIKHLNAPIGAPIGAETTPSRVFVARACAISPHPPHANALFSREQIESVTAGASNALAIFIALETRIGVLL